MCFDEGVRGLACGRLSEKHFICAECAPREVERVLQDLKEPMPLERHRERDGRIKCILNECAATYSDAQLVAVLPARIAQEYRQATAEVAQYRRTQQQEESARRIHQNEAAASARYLQRHFPNAVQCPRCGAGPVIPERCWDLGAHHGEMASGGGQISNACPACKFFSRERRDWAPWDGRMRGAESHTNTQRPRPLNLPSPRSSSDALPRSSAGSWMWQLFVMAAVACLLLANVPTRNWTPSVAPSGVLAYDASSAASLSVGETIHLPRQPGLTLGRPSTHFRAYNLPRGLTIDKDTGTIAGTVQEVVSRRIEVIAFTHGVAGGPSATLLLRVRERVRERCSSIVCDVTDSVLAGVGSMVVGGLYWLVTQND